MSDMMKNFVKQELDDQIKTNYPHMRYPPCIYARVVKASKKEDVYTVTLKILDKTSRQTHDSRRFQWYPRRFLWNPETSWL